MTESFAREIRTGLLVACAVGAAACSAAPPPRDAHENLNAVLWMQTSAEYRVLVEATYRAAGDKVVELARLGRADPSRLASAALEQPGRNTSKLPLAVVMDLDETMLDNSPLAAELIARRSGFDRELWSTWVRQRRADFLAGAERFVQRARAAGVEVLFVTNRREPEEPCTIEDLRPLVVRDEQVLTVGETDPETGVPWDKEKAARREAIARDWWILVLVGDDLGDFLPGMRGGATAEARVQAASVHLDRFGDRWFLLPNPVYGSWEDAVSGGGGDDAARLAEKQRRLRRMSTDPGADCVPAPPQR